MALLTGTTAEIQNKDVTEEVEKTTGRVAAIVAYFPPTDLNGIVEYHKSAGWRPFGDLTAEQLKELSPG